MTLKKIFLLCLQAPMAKARLLFCQGLRLMNGLLMLVQPRSRLIIRNLEYASRKAGCKRVVIKSFSLIPGQFCLLKSTRNSKAHTGSITVLILLAVCNISGADQGYAFKLEGKYENVFADKHNNAASFVVKAFGSNALFDITFENGFRQLAGTDGKDSFQHDSSGLATIRNGRYPAEANDAEKLLWLVCVHDNQLIAEMGKQRFNFYGYYNSTDIVTQVTTNDHPPFLVTSIKWYAPNSIVIGTNRFPLFQYPKGWLLGELAVTKTNLIGFAAVPGEVSFTQFKQRPFKIANPITNQIATPKGIDNTLTTRSPVDVDPVEYSVFTITNSQADQQLASYIPKILDPSAHIIDRRNGNLTFKVLSGKWWTVQERFHERQDQVKSARKVIIICLFALLGVPIFLLINRLKKKSER